MSLEAARSRMFWMPVVLTLRASCGFFSPRAAGSNGGGDWGRRGGGGGVHSPISETLSNALSVLNTLMHPFPLYGRMT